MSKAGSHEASKAASESFRDTGIPGIKYLDQGSRNMGPRISKLSDAKAHLNKLRSEEGRTRNYVVFDDKLIEILRKYGLLPPAVAAGALASQPGTAEASQK